MPFFLFDGHVPGEPSHFIYKVLEKTIDIQGNARVCRQTARIVAVSVSHLSVDNKLAVYKYKLI